MELVKDKLYWGNEDPMEPPSPRLFVTPIVTIKDLEDNVYLIISQNFRDDIEYPINLPRTIESALLGVCLYSIYTGKNMSESIEQITSLIGISIPKRKLLLLKMYEKPLTVLCCGAKNAISSFEDSIKIEYEKLPRYTTIMCFDSVGIDKLCQDVAKGMKHKKFAVKIITEKNILEKIDLVLAFHPDIDMSQNTRNLCLAAKEKGVQVIIADTERSLVF